MTVKRKNRMYVRIHVPTSLQDLLGCKEIVRTLKTESAAEAKLIDEDIKRQLPALWREIASTAHHNSHYTQEALQESVKGQIDYLVEFHVEQFAQARLRRHQSNPLQADLLEQVATLTAQVAELSGQQASAPAPTLPPELETAAKEEGPLWSAVAAEWLEEKKLSVKPSSIKDYQGYLPVMQAALAFDKPIASITRAEFTIALKRLGTMKSSHGKPFSQRSVEKYSLGFSMVCNYAVRAGYLSRNICPAVTKKSKKAAGGEKWKPFTDGELAKLFALPDMNSPKKLHLRAIALTGIFSGLRLAEIVQLHLSDLKMVDGVQCFDVNDDGDKELKSAASRRIVPVHPNLTPILDDFVQQAKAQGSKRVFPGLSSPAVSKQLNRIIKKVADGPVFHSTRKRFAKALTDNGIDKNLTAALLGHADDLSVTTIYTGAYSSKALAAAVNAIEYPFLSFRGAEGP